MSLLRKCLDSTGRFHDRRVSALSRRSKNPPMESKYWWWWCLMTLQRHAGWWNDEADESDDSAKTGWWWKGGGCTQNSSMNEWKAGDNHIRKIAARWLANIEGVSLCYWTKNWVCERVVFLSGLLQELLHGDILIVSSIYCIYQQINYSHHTLISWLNLSPWGGCALTASIVGCVKHTHWYESIQIYCPWCEENTQLLHVCHNLENCILHY